MRRALALFAVLGMVAGLQLFVMAACTAVPWFECSRGPDGRLARYDDPREARSLVGRSRDEVTREIGTPTSERFASEWDASYWLRAQGFCMDGWFLVLDYDADDRVADARIVGD